MTDLDLANKLIAQAREEWRANNNPSWDTDIVTPYDVWFYKVRGETMFSLTDARRAVARDELDRLGCSAPAVHHKVL